MATVRQAWDAAAQLSGRAVTTPRIHAPLHLVGVDLHHPFLPGADILFLLRFLEAMTINIIADKVRVVVRIGAGDRPFILR